MDFALTEQQEMIRKEVATLAGSFSLDYWLGKDRKHEYPWDFVKALARAGWLGAIIPEAYGGSGLGVTEAASCCTRSARPAPAPAAPRRFTSTCFRRCPSSSTA